MNLASIKNYAALGSLAVFAPGAIPLAFGVSCLAVYYGAGRVKLDYVRPSTLLRVGEDAVLGTVHGVTKRVRATKRAVVIEYQARRLASMESLVVAMNEDQRKQMQRDFAEISARADELRAKRRGTTHEELRA